MTKYLLILFLFLSHCTSMEVKTEALQATDSYKQELESARSLAKKSPAASLSKLESLINNYPENSLTDDALYLQGNLFLKVNKKRNALKSFSKILDSKYASPLDGKALIRKVAILAQLGEQEQSLKALDYIKYHKLVDTSSLEKIEAMRAPLLLKEGRYMDFLYSSNNVISKTTDSKLASSSYRKAIDVIKIKLTKDEIKKVLESPDLNKFHPQAALNLTELYFEDDEPEKAIENLERYAHLLEDPVYKSRKDELLMRGHIYSSPNKDVIGVIVPLSGKYEFVGQQILKGLQYSLGLWDQNKNKINFKLAVVDSEADPNQVSLAFDELMKNDKPIAIVGGLVGKTAEAILEKSREYKVPSVVLSQKEGLTENSKYSFQSSQPLDIYTDLISAIALEKRGIKKVAILHSEKTFSKKYAEAFAQSFTKRGGEIVTSIEYDLSERRAIPNAVRNLVGLLTPEGREDEYESALRKWRRTTRGRGRNNTPDIEELLKPLVEFDALFVADGAKNGGLIASTLAYFDVEDQILLGTHLWNDSALLERGQRFIENAIFASSYFEPSILSSQCGQDYFAKFQEPIDNYIYRGIETGVILSSVFNYFDIDTRGALLNAIQKTSTITHKCVPSGLAKKDHNFTSPLRPLTVKEKSIVLMDLSKNSAKQDERQGF